MKHLDLFSGIGGFALAARWAGIETVAFCEKDAFCQKVLKKHWPDVPIYDDIKDFDGTQFTGIDLLTGGYPCQPFSLAGKRKGEEDDRHLWPEMLRVIEQARPAFILSENVAGHVSMGLDDVLFDLESLGYAARPLIIPACAVDADHRRDRVWIIAHAELHGRNEAKNARGTDESKEKSGVLEPEGCFSVPERVWKGRPEHRKPNGLLSKTGLCRNDDGIPDRVDRVKSLGNAIVPQVAYALINAIVMYNALFRRPLPRTDD